MGSEILMVEARLKDFVSKNLDNINKKIEENNRQIAESPKNTKKAEDGFLSLAGRVFLTYQAFDKITKLITSSISAWDSQVQAQITLGRAVGFYSKKLEEQAGVLQLKTGYEDEAIMSGQAQLAVLGLQEEQIVRLTPLILDFAKINKMEVAEAGKTVAKSIMLGTSTLSRYGIEIKGSAKSNARFEATIAGLTSAYKGQSDIVTTGMGGLKIMSVIYGDMAENIGKELQPVLDTLYLYFKENIPLMTDSTVIFGKTVASIFFGIKSTAEFFVAGTVKTMAYFVDFIISSINLASTALSKLPKTLQPKDFINGLNIISGSLSNFNSLLDIVATDTITDSIDSFKKLTDVWTKPIEVKMPEIKGKTKSSVGLTDEEKTDLEKKKKEILDTSQLLTESQINYSYLVTKNTLEQNKKEAESALNNLDIYESINILNFGYLQDRLTAEQGIKAEYAKAELDNITSKYSEESMLLDLKYMTEQEKYKDNKQALLNLAEQHQTEELALEEQKNTALIAYNDALLTRDKEDSAKKKALAKEGMSTMADNFKEMSGLWKSFGRVYQGIAIAQAVMDAQGQAIAAGKSAAQIPYVGFVMAPIAMAASYAATLARINVIRQQKFASGGIVQGNTLTGDKVPALVNSREMILNTTQQANLLALANGQGGDSGNKNKYDITINIPTGKIDNNNISDVNVSLQQLADRIAEADRKGFMGKYNNRKR
jgi:hypothetical protein